MPLESDAAIRDLLRQTHTIAVLGIKDDPEQDAHRVPHPAGEPEAREHPR
jgi:predicted CoA-binding protein